jgi:hypothetical protein
MSCIGALVIAASAVMGQLDESGSTREHLKELQFFVGEWKYEGEESGEKVTGTAKAEWMNDKSFVLVRSVTTMPDGRQMNFAEIIGWDPVKKQVRSWGFGALGGYGQFTWAKNGDKWIMESDQPWIRWNGDRLTGTTVRARIDDNTYVEEGSYRYGDIVLTTRLKSERVK